MLPRTSSRKPSKSPGSQVAKTSPPESARPSGPTAKRRIWRGAVFAGGAPGGGRGGGGFSGGAGGALGVSKKAGTHARAAPLGGEGEQEGWDRLLRDCGAV